MSHADALAAAQEAAAIKLREAGVDVDLVVVAAVHTDLENPEWRFCSVQHPNREAIEQLPDGEHVLMTLIGALVKTVHALGGGRIVHVGQEPGT